MLRDAHTDNSVHDSKELELGLRDNNVLLLYEWVRIQSFILVTSSWNYF